MALSKEQHELIEALYAEGLKSATIAKRLGLVHEDVQAYLSYRRRTG